MPEAGIAMPYVLGIVSFTLFIGCIIHAIRNDRVFPWIFILIFLPGIGSLLYLFLEIVPGLVSARQTGAVKRGMTKLANPNRDLKVAKREVELVGSADAKRKLAEEYIFWFKGLFSNVGDATGYIVNQDWTGANSSVGR